jgi:eukaryotic-like serine/threonine-protein kinase
MGAVDDAPERFGSYLVYEQLGLGGMAQVHRAELPQKHGPPRQVALKRLLPTLRREIVQLFLDEARLLRYLQHDNIAATYDSGKVFGTYFIAMEYVRGPTLKELVAHCGATVGTVPEPITLYLAAQLCDALDHAHNRCDEHGTPLGIIHRDITPHNIILSDTGLLKLIDFGLAKAKVSSEETEQGVIKGKFAYVAPEYLGGRLDHRADLWAVGIIMYELLTSRRLFDGPDPFETMMRVRQLPIPRPSLANPRVTPALDHVVMSALERDPQRRWQTAAAMRDALRAVIAQPGNAVDTRHVVDWVRWAFTQEPGSEASGVAKLARLVQPTAPPQPPPVPPQRAVSLPALPPGAPRGDGALDRASMVWIACALALVFLLVVSLVWKVAT